jgi:hypothetical protein
MIAKLNSERAGLNERARELMRAEGQLGKGEVKVGEASFAVGDEVITRVNDHHQQIYNRERWRVEAAEVEARAVALAGIDTARRCVSISTTWGGWVWPTRRWTARSSTSPPRARARRPTST